MGAKTRDQLVEAATRQFAQRGFYGASIANIADELGLTKQALLHHFGSKEKLYGEVLRRISERLSERLEEVTDADSDPASQFRDAILGLYESSVRGADDTQVIMRELLDNKRRAERAETWYLKPFLDALIDMVRRTEGRGRKPTADLLAIVYEFLGAANYFAMSTTTLRKMYGRAEFERLKKRYPAELRRAIDTRLAAGD